jgi:hypothetical protein
MVITIVASLIIVPSVALLGLSSGLSLLDKHLPVDISFVH